MSGGRPPQLPPAIRGVLDAEQVRWQLRSGKKHWKLFVEGRLALVISHGTPRGSGRQVLNGVREVKKCIRLIKGNQP